MTLIEAQEAGLACFISDKVSDYAIISNLVYQLPLDDINKWIECIVSYRRPKKIVLNDKNWDIKGICAKLEQNYLDALDSRENLDYMYEGGLRCR